MSVRRGPGRYPAEFRERAVRMVFEAERRGCSQWEAISSPAATHLSLGESLGGRRLG